MQRRDEERRGEQSTRKQRVAEERRAEQRISEERRAEKQIRARIEEHRRAKATVSLAHVWQIRGIIHGNEEQCTCGTK